MDVDANDDSTGGNNFRGGIIIMALPEDDEEDVKLLAILVFCVVAVVNAGVRIRCFHSGLSGTA